MDSAFKTPQGKWVLLTTWTFWLCVVPLQLFAEDVPTQKSALLIGVSRYVDGDKNGDNDIPHLPWVTRDITELAHVLKERGDYQTVRQLYDPAETEEKTNDVLPPTRKNIQKELETFLKDREAHETLMIYFSGHGTRDRDGKLYLLPRDCDLDHLPETAICAAWLNQQIRACRAGVKFLVIDSCHAGDAAREPTKPSALNRTKLNNGAVIKDDFPPESDHAFIVFASCMPSQESYPYQPRTSTGRKEPSEQSLFSYWFTQGLKGDADQGPDGVIEWHELAKFVTDRVQKAAWRQHREQTPWSNTSVVGKPRDTPLIRLKPISREIVIKEIADKLYCAVKYDADHQGPLGVCKEFQPVGRAKIKSTGLLGTELAATLYQQLSHSYSGDISVKNEQEYRQWQKEIRPDFKKAGFYVVGKFLSGDKEDELVLRADVYEMSKEELVTQVGGMIKLERRDRFSKDSLIATAMEDNGLEPKEQQFAKGPHPLEAEKFPFDVRILVTKKGNTELFRPEVRKPIVVNNQAYVELNIGETYEIEVNYDRTIKDHGDRVCLQLFVDGISILDPNLPQKSQEVIANLKGSDSMGNDSKGIQTKEIQINANSTKREDCGFWVHSEGRCCYQGYYFQTQPEKHYDFEFVKEEESLVRVLGRGEPTGVVSAFFYKEDGKLGGGNAGGTRPAVEPQEGGFDVVEAGRLGELVTSMHLQCISREEMERKREEKRKLESNLSQPE